MKGISFYSINMTNVLEMRVLSNIRLEKRSSI